MNDAIDDTKGGGKFCIATLKVHKAMLVIVVIDFARSLTIDR